MIKPEYCVYIRDQRDCMFFENTNRDWACRHLTSFGQCDRPKTPGPKELDN
jgi:hypothetical protein